MEFESSPNLVLKDSDMDTKNLSSLIRLSGSAGKKNRQFKGYINYRYIINILINDVLLVCLIIAIIFHVVSLNRQIFKRFNAVSQSAVCDCETILFC